MVLNLDTLESISEISRNFPNMVIVKLKKIIWAGGVKN